MAIKKAPLSHTCSTAPFDWWWYSTWQTR